MCGKHKPLYMFYRNVRSQFGVGSYCKDCSKINNVKWSKIRLEREREESSNPVAEEKYKTMTDEEIYLWNRENYTGDRSKLVITGKPDGGVHQVNTTIDHIDYRELRKIKRECGFTNQAEILRIGLQLLIFLYKEKKDFTEWKVLLKEKKIK